MRFKIKTFNLILLVLMATFLAACQTAPTKTFEQNTVRPKAETLDRKIIITDKTVLLDARVPFEYSVSHLNGAINVRWDDFTQREKPFVGLLDLDLFAITRKLARLGIDPNETPVVVVGKGILGQGEEGRVAWTLKYLGVKNVRFINLGYFTNPMTTQEAPPRENKSIWKPQLDESLIVSKSDFLLQATKVKVIDVRTENEYLGRTKDSLAKLSPDIGAINVPWTEFFDAEGFANETVAQKLSFIGIHKNTPIQVISNKGVRSAAVTMALRSLGFVSVANFAGGYSQLVYQTGTR